MPDVSDGTNGAEVTTRSLDASQFGPYATLVNTSHVSSLGATWSWYLSPSGDSVVAEVRGNDGQLADMQLIRLSGTGLLSMLRLSNCPDGVCGQTGTVRDGIVRWKEPKASGGSSGEHMDVLMWRNGDVLFTFTMDPTPAGGIQIYDQFPQFEYLRPKRMPMALQLMAPQTPEQIAESRGLIAALEPQVDGRVAQALGNQAAIAQEYADRRAARQRSSERVQAFNRAMEGMNGVLTAADEVATANEAQSRADLDATIAQMNPQAALERQQQRAGEQPIQQSQPSQPAAAQSSTASPIADGTASDQATASTASGAPGGPLTFLLWVPITAIINNLNGSCFSSIATIPGPPGWPVRSPTNDKQLHEMVSAYIPGFLAKCAKAGPVRSGGIRYFVNARGSEKYPAEEHARNRRNKMFEVQVSP